MYRITARCSGPGCARPLNAISLDGHGVATSEDLEGGP
jgi:hypothetical protein